MMMFDEMGFCGDFDAFCGPLGEGDIAARQTEPDAVVEDDYSDEEIDVDELERRMWRDKMRLKRLKEQSKAKEGIDAAKQRQSQEQARRKKMSLAQDGISKYMLKMMEVCKAEEGIDAAKQRQSQEQARRKKIEEQSHARLRLRKEFMQQSKGNPRNKPGGRRLRSNPMHACLSRKEPMPRSLG